MKAKITFVLLAISVSAFGEHVPADKAREAASDFITSTAPERIKGTSDPVLSLVPYSRIPSLPVERKAGKKVPGGDPAREALLYVFNINQDEGFIIVSGDDRAVPILGFSFEGGYDLSLAPSNLRKWVEGYAEQIRYLRSTGQDQEPAAGWENLLSGEGRYVSTSTSEVDPLITTKWDQSPYVNDLCPWDDVNDGRALTGCVATAMAQIMKFWEYPEKGSGFHSYNHTDFGMLSANFGSTTYDWAAMTDEVNSENLAVATLMYHCGVSVEMDYGVESSGAYTNLETSPVEHCAQFAIVEYFGYDDGCRSAYREDYSDAGWVQLLKSELDEGRPMLFGGYSSEGGHAFICDGYDTNEFFHFNWGWGGYFDGFFAIDALNPGVEDDDDGFNTGQDVIMGIRPSSSTPDIDLALYENISLSGDSVMFNGSFTLHTDIANFGTTDFTGDFCAAVFDLEGYFVDYIEILEDYTLESGNHYINGLDFTTEGSIYMLPGEYEAEIYYRNSGGNWQAVGDGDYENDIGFDVYYSTYVEIYSGFVIDSGPDIMQYEPFSVSADILFEGSGSFQGEFAIDLLEMSGDFMTTVDEVALPSIDSGYYYSGVTFNSDGVHVTSGSYLMALYHKPDGGEWDLTGSTYYPNPVRILVRGAPLVPDVFEVNDSIDDPAYLPLIFSGGEGSITTEGANSHIGTDVDYYWIELEEGYHYTIKPRMHDSYDSGNEDLYSADMVWAYWIYSVSGEWSDLYDDVMEDSITLPDGGAILFWVVPYFEGGTGTYLFDIRATRSSNTSAGERNAGELLIYPNPATGLLHVTGEMVIDRLVLLDACGRALHTSAGVPNSFTLDVSWLDEGVYFLKITQKGFTSVHKFVKQ